jgi:hypothetical protein
MPFDSTNRFVQILDAAHAERKRRQLRDQVERERHARPKIDFVPETDKPIPFEVREYLHAKVKELLR